MPQNPLHVVLIPDGNRRWARAQGLPELLGHREGAKATEKILDAALKTDITHLTFWGASVANLTKRSPEEVGALAEIFEIYFKKLAEHPRLHEHKIRVRVLGRWAELLPAPTVAAVENIIKVTEGYGERNLTVLLAYTGTDEILYAINRIANAARKDLELVIDEKFVKMNLWTAELPPVDFVIRTGGEPHWSAGMLMWDVAEAHLHFAETFWPAFSETEFLKALENFKNTARRFGQ